jgi:hypothetical protein
MGNTAWIDVRGRAGSETHHDMSVLLRLDQRLDVLAVSLGVTKLTEFYDYRELISKHDRDDEEIVADQWFDSTSGLATFRALRLFLESNWDAFGWTPDESEQHWRRTLMDDLGFCEKVLEQAVSNEQEFRLLIVP